MHFRAADPYFHTVEHLDYREENSQMMKLGCMSLSYKDQLAAGKIDLLKRRVAEANTELGERNWRNVMTWMDNVAGPGRQRDLKEMGSTIDATGSSFHMLTFDIESISTSLGVFDQAVDDSAAKIVDVFKPLPDQIQTSLDEFGDNMADWLTTMNEWLAGLKLLASRGMGDLAEVFHEEGLGTLDVLNKALADPTKAAVLNATARELGIGMARSTVDAYAQWLKDNLESELRESAERVYGYGEIGRASCRERV